jgi:Glyoxalase/Bleomycin resistance protein/Dioxygenase superfamily
MMTMGERVVSLVVTLAIPLLIWLFLHYLATYRRVAMKPLRPWLIVTSIALFAVSLFYDVGNNPRVSNLLRVGAWSAWTILLWINRRAMFASVSTGWYKWRRGSLMIPRGIHIPVESVETLSPWYTEKLGLRRMTSVPEYEGAGSVGYKFNEDGMPIILTPSDKRKTQRTPIFFTKKIEKVRDILRSRGIEIGAIVRDRQGIRFFEIHDPEGNAIEVVEG